MALKVARRGRNAGGQFWGCTNFPDCRGTRDVELEDGGQRETVEEATPALRVTRFRCRSHLEGYQTAHFQSAPLPKAALDALGDGIPEDLALAFSGWRLDYPLPQADQPPRLDRTLLSLAESLLLRGTTPLPYPAIEERLEFGSESDYERALRQLVFAPRNRPQPGPFESEEERLLASYLEDICVDEGLAWYFLSQVDLASLTTQLPAEAEQRGDLLLLHPRQPPVLVEVDGPQHAAHEAADATRDAALEGSGVRVVRVPTGEVRSRSGPALLQIKNLLRDGAEPMGQECSVSAKLRLLKTAHQLQVVILKALGTGFLSVGGTWRINVVPHEDGAYDAEEKELFRESVRLLAETLGRLARISGLQWNEPEIELVTGELSPPRGTLTIAPATAAVNSGAFLVSDVPYPGRLEATMTPGEPINAPNPTREDVLWFLRYIFRKPDFLEGQWETVSRLLRGLDTLVLLPTGGGKSIAFQLAALLRPGRCIVVDPIISLIEDQVANLRAYGIDRSAGISSQLTAGDKADMLSAFQSGHFLFTFVAPERFQMPEFRESLRALTSTTPVSLVAIDEAHCVSEWGHDFRTAYLNLGRTTREYCRYFGVAAPMVGLTGTASRIVLKDVQRELDISDFDAIVAPESFDRPELQFTVTGCRSDEKQSRLKGLINRLPAQFGLDPSSFFLADGHRTNAGLVFCPHVNGDYGIVAQAKLLTESVGVRVGTYSGSSPRGVSEEVWNVRKRAAAADFKRNRVPILACTKAFGMGIDKPNIRYTVHLGIPQSIEAFYQEAGRAGRDRAKAVCAMIVSDDQPQRSRALLNPSTPLEEVERAVDRATPEESDDVMRALFFHVKSFRGRQQDSEDVAAMLDRLGEISTERTVTITWHDPAWGVGSERKARAEKAMHRLVVLGIVRDYSINYSGGELTAYTAGADRAAITQHLSDYVGAYQMRLGDAMRDRCVAIDGTASIRDFAKQAGRLLVDFIYDHVELARRRSLREMLQAATTAAEDLEGGERLRANILEYLQQTEWDQRLDQIRQESTANLIDFEAVLDSVVSPRDAMALRGAANRQLSSYPDVPLLLLIRATSEALAPDCDAAVVKENIVSGIRFGLADYGYSPSMLATAVELIARRVAPKRGAAMVVVTSAVAASNNSRVWLRELVKTVPEHFAAPVLNALDGILAESIRSLLGEASYV